MAIPPAATAATYWQVQQPDITVVAEGDKDLAKTAAGMTLRLRSAARQLLGWPDSYREPPVLIFVVDERLLERNFTFPRSTADAYRDITTVKGAWARTPSLTVVTAPLRYERGYELRPLGQMYGHALVRATPSHYWPACAHLGMTMVFTMADFTAPNHFFLPADRIFLTDYTWSPEKLLVPTNGPRGHLPQYERDEWGSSCYLFGFMIAAAQPAERSALTRMLTALGRGVPLSDATTAELHQSLPEFSDRFREFARELKVSPVHFDVRIDMSDEIPPIAEPTPVSLPDLQTLMSQLCIKMHNCRK